jgi:hypothetical protein
MPIGSDDHGGRKTIPAALAGAASQHRHAHPQKSSPESTRAARLGVPTTKPLFAHRSQGGQLVQLINTSAIVHQPVFWLFTPVCLTVM